MGRIGRDQRAWRVVSRPSYIMEKTLRCFKLKGFFNGFFDALFNLLSRVAVAEFVICDWECLLLFVETQTGGYVCFGIEIKAAFFGFRKYSKDLLV